MTPLRLIATSIAALLLIVPAVAQTPGQRIILEQSSQPQRQEGSVRIQSNINLFMPGATGEGNDAQNLRERARRLVYEMAADECDLLRDVLAKDCRLESVNTNLSRQLGQQQEGYTVNGSMSFQIALK